MQRVSYPGLSDDPDKLLWWWCDALFMSPPVLLRMYEITHDKKYLDYMDHEWWLTSASLYYQENHLYFRDSRYFTQKQANGKPIFWSRGNGWVMGALVNVLRLMPADYPSRPKYVAQFREMVAQIAAIQSPDGLWRSGLLDPDAYDLPEVSGSAFFTFGIAYGINEKILDRKTYLPVVEKSWKGMLTHIYADGRLGSIQPIDGQPDAGPGALLELTRDGRHFGYLARYTDLSPEFRSQLGYVKRVDIRQIEQEAQYRWRPKHSPVVKFGPTVSTLWNRDRAGRVQDWSFNGQFKVDLIRETKSSTVPDELRGTENQKIHCGKRHFTGALGVDYRVVTSADELP